MDILVVKMSALGDVIQALPVIPALKTAYPNSTIHWLVEETAAPIVRAHRGVDRVLVSRRTGWGANLKRPGKWWKVVGEIREMVSQLHARRYDMAIDLQGLLKSGIWMGLSSAQRKIGYAMSREGSYLFLNERIQPVSADIHAIARYLLLVKKIGARVERVEFGLSASPEARRGLQEMLKDEKMDFVRPYAVMVPTARWETKEWVQASFAQLADALIEDFDLQVVMTGVKRDAAKLSGIIQQMKHPALNLAGKTDLPALMALLEGARVAVSTDSGPMHLAAALGTPLVALFGPTAPWRTGPYGRVNRVVRSHTPCSPCFQKKCGPMTCMKKIRHEKVREAVGDVLFESAYRAPPSGAREVSR